MKLRSLLLATSPIVLTVAPLATTLTSCGKMPSVQSVEIRRAPVWVINKQSGTPVYQGLGLEYPVDVYHFNKSEIGYIDVDDYVNIIMQNEYWLYDEKDPEMSQKFSHWNSTTKDGKTTIINDSNKATCVIDYNNQTLTFDDYDAFLQMQKIWCSPLGGGPEDGEKYYSSVSAKYFAGKQIVMDLTKYNIKLYYHNGCGYIPYDLFRNIINPQPYKYMFYNGVGFYEVYNKNLQTTIDLYKQPAKEATVYTTENMEFSYNLLALTLDYRFGLKERPSRVETSKTIKYFEKGAYAALKPYHDRIVSLNSNVSNDALCEFFANEVDDGGHAGYAGLNLLCTKPFDSGKNIGPEKKNTFAADDKLVAARRKAGYEPTNGQEYREMTVTGSDKKVAWITFDGFNNDEIDDRTGAEVAAKRMLEITTTSSNYSQNTMRLFIYANQQIRNNNIKDVVIDLSCNGGGTVYTEHFIASWLCNGVDETIYDPNTGAYSTYNVKADINGDGLFNDKDYIGDDVNVYVITSPASFSCGNMLPCNLKDCRPSTYFIGERCGGGACYVDGNMHVGLGNVYRSSSNFHMLRNSSTRENPISVESGVEVDYSIDWRTDEGAAKYYDRDTINKRILGIA